MIFKRTLSAVIALAMTAGMTGAVPATAEAVSSDNRAMSATSGNLSIDGEDTHATKGDVNGDGKITDDDSKLLNNWLTRSIGKNDLDLKNADVNLDGKVNILDLVELNRLCKESTSEQPIGEDSEALSAINTEDNAFKLSVDITAAGDAETLLSADESGYSNAIKSDMVVGVVPELEYEEGYAVEEVTLNFDIKDELTDDGKYASVSDDFKGVRKFNVFKYFEDIDMLLPIETNYTEDNTITTTVDELGTYCLVDMEKWFETLGIKPEELAAENTVPSSVNMMGTSGITADKNPLIYSTSSEIELSTVSNKKIDIILDLFLYSGSKDGVVNQANILGNSIFNSCDDSCSVNIYVVDYRGKPLAVPGTGKAYAENTDEFNAIFEKGITKRKTSTKPSLENFVTNFLENYSLRKDASKYYIAVESDEVTAKNLDGIKTRLSNEDILPFLVTNINMDDHASLVGSPDAYCDKIVAYSRPAYEFIISYLNKNTYIIPTGWKQISLDKPITNEYKTVLDDITQADKYDFTDRERFADTDEDGLIDLREIIYSFNGEDVITWDSDGKVILPTIKDCLKLKSGKKYVNNALSQYGFWEKHSFNNVRILPIYSDPTEKDTDFDGINDEKDHTKTDSKVCAKLTTEYTKNKTSTSETGRVVKTFYGDIDYAMDIRAFFNHSSTYSRNLSTFAAVLSTVAYTTNDKRFVTIDETNMHAKELLEYYGFDHVTQVDLNDYFDDVHVSRMFMGHRVVEYKNVNKTIVAVVIEGTEGSIRQWTSNFDIGSTTERNEVFDWFNTNNTTGFDEPLMYWYNNNVSELEAYKYWTNPEHHKGFDIVANRLKEKLDQYTSSYVPGTNVAYYITGHSRGAAVSNILSASLIDEGNEVFAYTFACPSTTTKHISEDDHTYDSIFNIVNEDDFVPCVPMNTWHFSRYGTTASGSILDDYEKKWEDIMINQSNNKKIDYNPDAHEDLAKTVKALSQIAIAPEDYIYGNDLTDAYYRYVDDDYFRNNCYEFTIDHGENTDNTSVYYSKKQYNLIPENAKPFCSIAEKGDKYIVCQTPAYFMQLLASFMAGELSYDDGKGGFWINNGSGPIDENEQFVVELNVATRYEDAKSYILFSGNPVTGGLSHPHYLQSYYILSKSIRNCDFRKEG